MKFNKEFADEIIELNKAKNISLHSLNDYCFYCCQEDDRVVRTVISDNILEFIATMDKDIYAEECRCLNCGGEWIEKRDGVQLIGVIPK